MSDKSEMALRVGGAIAAHSKGEEFSLLFLKLLDRNSGYDPAFAEECMDLGRVILTTKHRECFPVVKKREAV